MLRVEEINLIRVAEERNLTALAIVDEGMNLISDTVLLTNLYASLN